MARVKVVTGSDGRTWRVSRQMLLRMPAVGEDFEHDVAGGRAGGGVILGMLVFFYLALLSWWSSDIHMPAWLRILGFVALMFFPVRWVLRRPWKLTAQTPGRRDLNSRDGAEKEEGTGKEHWVGTVRGVTKARDETSLVIRSIRMRGRPSHADGPMQLVN